jgi:hypothetical protein
MSFLGEISQKEAVSHSFFILTIFFKKEKLRLKNAKMK